MHLKSEGWPVGLKTANAVFGFAGGRAARLKRVVLLLFSRTDNIKWNLWGAFDMKSNRWNLITAFLDMTAGVCFLLAAAFHAEMPSKGLCGIAAVCSLGGGVGFLCTYIKKRKNGDK